MLSLRKQSVVSIPPPLWGAARPHDYARLLPIETRLQAGLQLLWQKAPDFYLDVRCAAQTIPPDVCLLPLLMIQR